MGECARPRAGERGGGRKGRVPLKRAGQIGLTTLARFCLRNYKGRLVCTNGVQSLPFTSFGHFLPGRRASCLPVLGSQEQRGKCRVANLPLWPSSNRLTDFCHIGCRGTREQANRFLPKYQSCAGSLKLYLLCAGTWAPFPIRTAQFPSQHPYKVSAVRITSVSRRIRCRK